MGSTHGLTEKAFLEIEGSAETMPCMFNPAELSVSQVQLLVRGFPCRHRVFRRSSTWAPIPGRCRCNLTFDTTDTGEAVTKHTGKVLKLMDVDPSLPGTDPQTNNARPPYVIFHWGNLHSFKAVVSSLNLQFTYFSSTGVPLRAKVDLLADAVRRVRGIRTAEPDVRHAGPASGAPGPARRDARPDLGPYYGDSTRWRAIAAANGVVDPLALRTGSLLSIPQGRPMTSPLHVHRPGDQGQRRARRRLEP